MFTILISFCLGALTALCFVCLRVHSMRSRDCTLEQILDGGYICPVKSK